MIESMTNVPGIYVLLFFLAALLVRRFRLFFILMAFLFYILSTYWFGNIAVKQIEKPYNVPLKETKTDGVVVLGGGYYTGSSNLPLSEGSFKRMMYALMIAKKHHLPLVYAGADNETIAAEDTVRELNHTLDLNLHNESNTSLGDDFSITYTQKSLNTIQNAMRSYDLFTANGIVHPAIYLVTSASHMHRAKGIFEDFGFTVIPAATDFKTRTDTCYCFYYPSIAGLKMTNIFIHEYLGSLRDAVKRILKMEG